MCRLGRYFSRRNPRAGQATPPLQENVAAFVEESSPNIGSSLCATCATLDLHKILSDGISREEAIPLGLLGDIMEKARYCGFCRLIKAAFQRTWVLDKQAPDVDLTGITCSLFSEECGCLRDPAPPMKELCHRIFILPSDRPQRIYDVMLSAQSGLTIDIQLLEDDAHIFARNKEVHGRKVEETANIDLIRKWLDICEQEHSGICGSVWWRGEDERLPEFVRMLDVETMSIVPAPPGLRYIALSYLWGGVGSDYQTTQANIKQRTAPRGLDISILPLSISDSIHLCLQLQVRYLWVDALCIIQDSMEDKATQIGVMELIYGSSYLTIFAVGGSNAHAPLPGLLPGTRTIKQGIEVIQDLHLTVPLPTLREVLAQSTWGTRGWTYQELMLSSRRLFFTNQQVYFECGQEIWCEDVVAESKRLPRSYHPLRNTGGGNFTYLRAPPSWLRKDYMLGYMTAITQYTQRDLTNESDAVDAVSALTNAMTKGFKLGGGQGISSNAFRYGMAIADLNQALLWQPTSKSLLVRRTVPAGAPWPSWSWAGWRGPVQYHDIINGRDVPRPMESLISHWYIYENGKLIELGVRPIDRAIAYPEEEGMYTRYIPPQGHIDVRIAPNSNDKALIFCTTTATFKVEADENHLASTDVHYLMFNILAMAASHPTRAGRIFLPLSVELSSSLRLIVLSRTNGSTDLYDTETYGRQYSGCFLYVMAVKQADVHSAFERLGVGIVFEKAWIDSEPQEIQVNLG